MCYTAVVCCSISGCVLVLGLSFSLVFFFFFKQKTAYEMRISDWSSDVCSSDLQPATHLVEDALLHNRPDRIPIDREFPQMRHRHHRGKGRMSRRRKARVGHRRMVEMDRQILRQHAVVVDGGEQQIGRASCRERGCQYV